MTTRSQVEAVAAGLTKGQVMALTYLQGSLSVCRRLREKGLAARVEGTGMAWEAYPVLSPLGLAVRDHLLKGVGSDE